VQVSEFSTPDVPIFTVLKDGVRTNFSTYTSEHVISEQSATTFKDNINVEKHKTNLFFIRTSKITLLFNDFNKP